MKKVLFLVFVTTFLVTSCSSSDDASDDGGSADGFDRKALLENIADNIAIPAYQSFANDMTALKTATSNFINTTNESNLVAVRNVWTDAYISWQSVGVFEIGKAEELSFINFMNVYPVNAVNIEANITDGNYDLNLVMQQDEQGFGALDYLLNGLAGSDTDIVAFYTSNANAANYKKYLSDLVNRMDDLTNQVLEDWINGYRDTFVNNKGSSATSSLDKIVNDYIFHYEKHLRAGKIGIPAGAFVGGPLEDKVEAFYKGDLSKTLFLANLNAMEALFNGKHFGKNTTGESFKTYLDFLNTIKEGEDLSGMINKQFNMVRTIASDLDDNFSSQVKNNNTLMLSIFDNLQKNVVHFKVDMLSAFSVRVDFLDADGD